MAMADNSAMINPETGFIEHPNFGYDFDSRKKLAFIDIYKQNGLKFWRTAAEIGVKGDTIHKHLALDEAFAKAVKQAETEYFDDLEGVSRENALNPRSVIERIFQLKARFPNRYGDSKRDSAINVTITVDPNLLQNVTKRQEIVEIEELPSDSKT
jgi:hypothetical protein